MSFLANILGPIAIGFEGSAGQSFLGLPPIVLVVLISLGLAFVVSIVNRLLLDIKKLRSSMSEISSWESERLEAMKSDNKKLLEKVNKRKPQMEKLRLEITKAQMKPTMIFFIPFWILFVLLSGYFGTKIVAQLPFFLPWLGIGDSLGFAWAYFFASLGTYPIIQRIMGVTMSVE